MDQIASVDKINAEKAAKWDALYKKIAACYGYSDEGESDEPEDTNSDLCGIGELAAIAFGFL